MPTRKKSGQPQIRGVRTASGSVLLKPSKHLEELRRKGGKPVVVLAPMAEPWEAVVEIGKWSGQLVVGSLGIRVKKGTKPEDIPAQGLMKKDLRSVDLAAAIESVLGGILGATYWPDLAIEYFKRGTAPAKRRHKTGDEYAEIALRYLRALQQSAKTPLVEMQRQYKSEGVQISRERLRDLVHGARREGFLTPSKYGFAGGTPTPKLDEWMKQRAPKKRRK